MYAQANSIFNLTKKTNIWKERIFPRNFSNFLLSAMRKSAKSNWIRIICLEVWMKLSTDKPSKNHSVCKINPYLCRQLVILQTQMMLNIEDSINQWKWQVWGNARIDLNLNLNLASRGYWERGSVWTGRYSNLIRDYFSLSLWGRS